MSSGSGRPEHHLDSASKKDWETTFCDRGSIAGRHWKKSHRMFRRFPRSRESVKRYRRPVPDIAFWLVRSYWKNCQRQGYQPQGNVPEARAYCCRARSRYPEPRTDFSVLSGRQGPVTAESFPVQISNIVLHPNPLRRQFDFLRSFFYAMLFSK